LKVLSDSATEIRVELGTRSYAVLVGDDLLGSLMSFMPEKGWRKAAVLTDSNVGPLYAAGVVETLRAHDLETVLLEVPPGEGSKTFEQAFEVIGGLMESGFTRSDVMFALGGGVVGDLAGFAASVFKRGIDLVAIPTTLMAQVDSSIGGKTAVNLPAAKNQVGTFHQPVAVLCDILTLATLSLREFRSGLAEVAKYSLITSRDWGGELRADPRAVAEATPETLARVAAECVREKAALVSADERDTGVRHYLNYGHTLGHALEAAGGYDGTYSHGEGVSVGMVYAALVSEATGLGRKGLAESHSAMLVQMGLPVAPLAPAPGFEDIEPRMARDKKSDGGFVMVLLQEEGRPAVVRDLDPSLLRSCYDALLAGDFRK
jgi:3-dehydroquinate synthase